jgi:hypothetical protein
MYMHDVWAAKASDAVLEKLPADAERPGGWITEDHRGVGIVTFAGSDGTTALYRATFRDGPRSPSVEVLPAGSPLTPEQRAMFAARKTALAVPFKPCSKRYNTIVLPAALLRKQGWLVYLVPAGTEPNLVRVGGHYRVHVSADGTQAISVTPFSKSCLTINLQQPGLRVEGIFIDQVVTDTPVESHVFLNLLHRLDVVVVTRKAVWKLWRGNAIFVKGNPE